MKLFQHLKKYGVKKGLQVFCRGWYNENKILLLIVLIIILLGILPIFPSSSTKTLRLDVPYTEDDHHFLNYGINIRDECNTFYLWNDIEKVRIIDSYTIYQNSYNSGGQYLPKAITKEFQNYNIGIFAIKSCDACIDDME